jgi:hypothetical protein
VPLFLAARDWSPFAKLVPKIAEGLGTNGCTHIVTGLIPGSVHYVVADLIERYASPHAECNENGLTLSLTQPRPTN